MAPQQILSLREDLGLGVEAFAARVGVNRMTVFRWETGRSAPKGLHLIRLQEIQRGLKRSRP
jgi:DNA-binding transcriptional regulator YiaG